MEMHWALILGGDVEWEPQGELVDCSGHSWIAANVVGGDLMHVLSKKLTGIYSEQENGKEELCGAAGISAREWEIGIMWSSKKNGNLGIFQPQKNE
ncbi:Os07g0148850 [Oryza sativa Japonica Group]|uniref:Os07g0148850 protein n=1 Tax=Oryza sativa subsp. japonica TaxID=39947 RepID=A0A0P0X2P7_ORYSJ|nr:Os07g0148850 [Oryza sativa Japonica Group]